MPAVPDGHNEHSQFAVFDLAENAVSAHLVPPQPCQVRFGPLAGTTRFVVPRDPLVEVRDDISLALRSEFSELLQGRSSNL